MAQSQTNSSLESIKEPIPSNEQLVDSLMSDLKDCVLKEGEKSRDELNPLSENDSQVSDEDGTKVRVGINQNTSCVLEENEGSNDEEEDDKDNSIPTIEDDLVDELAMKDLELSYTEEDRQVCCRDKKNLS